MSGERERLGVRPDFDDWADSLVTAVKKHRSRFGRHLDAVPVQDRSGPRLRRWASRMLTKIAE